jgi:hypothetical protein
MSMAALPLRWSRQLIFLLSRRRSGKIFGKFPFIFIENTYND